MTWTSSLRGVSLVFVLTAAAAGQVAPYNPYAPQVEEPPVTADGKLNWPTLFKSKKIEAKYESLWALGACRGSAKRINVPVANNKLDINGLGAGESSGEVVSVATGALTIATATREMAAVMIHPAGVSRVSVVGPMLPADLRAGMIVRVVALVDNRGQVDEPVQHLEVVSLPEQHEWQALEVDRRETITAQVVSLRGRKLTLMIPAGRVRRVNLLLDPDATAHVDCRDLRLAGPGDQVVASGHLYEGLIAGCPRAVFAADVKVTKRAAADASSSTAGKTASVP